MSHTPASWYIGDMKDDPTRLATRSVENQMEDSQRELEDLQGLLRVATKIDPDEEPGATPRRRFIDEQLRELWVERTLNVLAKLRDQSDQAIRDLVVYGVETGLKPHRIAKAARVGPGTVYRWKEAGAVESIGHPADQ